MNEKPVNWKKWNRYTHRYISAPFFVFMMALGVSGIYFGGYDLYFMLFESGATAGPAPTPKVEPAPFSYPLEKAMALARQIADKTDSSSDVTAILYRRILNQPVYEIKFSAEPYAMLIDGVTGEKLSPVSPEFAGRIALEAAALGPRVSISRIEKHDEYTFHHQRNNAYRAGTRQSDDLPFYAVWLDDPGTTLVTVTARGGDVTRVRNFAKRLYWYGYWFLHTFIFWPSPLGQAVSDVILILISLVIFVMSITGLNMFIQWYRHHGVH